MKQLVLLILLSLVAVCCTDDDEILVEEEQGTFIDLRDGNEYSWVRIGEQVWMAENLRYLPKVYPPDDESKLEPRYYVYDYFGNTVSEATKSKNYLKYGGLYNWEAALAAPPDGWHLPSDYEWEQLARYIVESNGLPGKIIQQGVDTWTAVGLFLKCSKEWGYKNGCDAYHFTGIAGGFKHYYGGFASKGNCCFSWSSDEHGDGNACSWRLSEHSSGLDHGHNDKQLGISVRCIKN